MEILITIHVKQPKLNIEDFENMRFYQPHKGFSKGTQKSESIGGANEILFFRGLSIFPLLQV